jgi:DNA-binding transcriptional ArsR family regulator
LRVLERAELVQMERKGNCRMVRLRADTLRLARNWLAYYEEFWQARLDSLAESLEGEEGK